MSKRKLAMLHILLMTIMLICIWGVIIIPAQPWNSYGWIEKFYVIWILFGSIYISWYYVYKPNLEIMNEKDQ
ncbi:hypothetical protein A8L34_27785 [Bacillus sp. FJAT-27264]|nr:hypothetical protein A8L34_27785 [Bacillus sp. FJAT-27264]